MERILLLGIGGMLLFAIGVIVFVLVHQRRVIRYQMNLQSLREGQQRLLLEAAIASEEKERQRIAGDLHDEVGASLSTIRLYLLQAARKNTLEQVAATMEAAKEVLDEVVSQVRQISHRLSPEMLMQFGLKDALQKMTQKLHASGGIRVSFMSPEEIVRLQPERELAVYRIVQEVIGNMLNHAAAAEIHLQLRQNKHCLIITAEDNGRGFTEESFEKQKNKPGSLGLKNIQSRVDILGATINFTERKDHLPGTLMTLNVPLVKVPGDSDQSVHADTR
jgi:signal transduction histidine kinase